MILLHNRCLHLSIAALFSILFVSIAEASELIPQIPPKAVNYEDYTADWTKQQAEEWLAALARIEEVDKSGLTINHQCQATWDIIWPLAKAGNLEARYALHGYFSHGYGLYYAGQGFDLLSRPRLLALLYFHSLGSPSLTGDINYMKVGISTAPSFAHNYPEFSSISSYPSIQQCVLDAPSQACTKMLVDRTLIVSFERFSVEVDALLKSDATINCFTRVRSTGEQKDGGSK